MYFWDERYAAPGYAYGTEPNDFLAEVAERIPVGGRVLCLADGEGRNGVFLARRGHAVTSVDLSPVGLRKAEALAAQHGVSITTVHADLADFPFEDGAWDGVVQRIPGFGKKVQPVIRDALVDESWPKFLHPYPLGDPQSGAGGGTYFLVACQRGPAARTPGRAHRPGTTRPCRPAPGCGCACPSAPGAGGTRPPRRWPPPCSRSTPRPARWPRLRRASTPACPARCATWRTTCPTRAASRAPSARPAAQRTP